MDIGCKLGISCINILTYADDIVLLSNSVENLNKIYTKFETNIMNLKLKINTNKSKVIIFEKNKKRSTCGSLTLNNRKFDIVKEYKYLGNIITFNLEDESDVKLKLNYFYSSFNSLYRTFTGLNLETILFLFNSYCCPQYRVPLWNLKLVLEPLKFLTIIL